MAPKRGRHNKGPDKPGPTPQKRVKVQVRMIDTLVLTESSLQTPVMH